MNIEKHKKILVGWFAMASIFVSLSFITGLISDLKIDYDSVDGIMFSLWVLWFAGVVVGLTFTIGTITNDT